MLLVVGTSGHVGNAVLKTLAGTPYRLRALLRTPDQPVPRAANIEVAVGDLAELSTVQRALEGVETAFLASSFAASLPELQIRFIEAAKAAGVRRIVQLSGMGANTNSTCVRAFSWYGQVEEALLASGLQHVRVRPSFTLQSLFAGAPDIIDQGLIYGPYRTVPWLWVDARDVGEVAVAAMTNEAHDGQIFTVTGSEAISFPELAECMSKVLNIPVRYLDVTSNEMRGRLQARGANAIVVSAMLEMCDAYVSGFLRVEATSVVRDLTGHAPRTVEQFLTDYRERFLRAA